MDGAIALEGISFSCIMLANAYVFLIYEREYLAVKQRDQIS